MENSQMFRLKSFGLYLTESFGYSLRALEAQAQDLS
jgi:hypothetical protein